MLFEGNSEKMSKEYQMLDKKEMVISLFLRLKSLLCTRQSIAPFLQHKLGFLIFSTTLFLVVSTRTKTSSRRETLGRTLTPSLLLACRFWRRLSWLHTWFHRLGLCWHSEPERSPMLECATTSGFQHQAGRFPLTRLHNKTTTRLQTGLLYTLKYLGCLRL